MALIDYSVAKSTFTTTAILVLSMLIAGQTIPQALAKNAVHNPQVGKTSSVVNLVIGDNLSTLRQLRSDDPVYALEHISAEPDSHGEILLNDNSRIVVGPGAEISLEDFVVNKSGIKSGTLKVLKGAFRFISGSSPQGTFKVTTPLSTIGIRGTSFDVYVNDDGNTDVIIYSGRVNVCTLDNKCRELHETCGIVRVSPNGRINSKRFLRSGNKARENRQYKLVGDQQRFSEGWRAPIEICDSRGATSHRNYLNINNNNESDADDSGFEGAGIGVGETDEGGTSVSVPE